MNKYEVRNYQVIKGFRHYALIDRATGHEFNVIDDLGRRKYPDGRDRKDIDDAIQWYHLCRIGYAVTTIILIGVLIWAI